MGRVIFSSLSKSNNCTVIASERIWRAWQSSPIHWRLLPEYQRGPDRRARIDRVRPYRNDLIKKTLDPLQGRERNFNTPAVPPWFPPLRRAPPLHGRSSCMDNNPCAHANVWQVRLSYLRIAAFRSQLRKDFQLVSLARLTPTRARWQ